MKKLFFIGITLAILTSCQKNDENPLQKKSDYLPLEIGNYWVYEHYKIDTLGNETKLSWVDSIVIKRDTIIGNNKYYIHEGIMFNIGWRVIEIVRDSFKYLVNDKGKILFSENNFSDILNFEFECFNDTNDTIYTISYRMENPTHQVNVPSGNFEVLNYRGDLTFYAYNNIDPPFINRTLNRYYAPNVGKILHTYYYASAPHTYERRLVRYNVANK
jgi:hypothetical protein